MYSRAAYLSICEFSCPLHGIQMSRIFRDDEMKVCVDLKRLRATGLDFSKLLLRAELRVDGPQGFIRLLCVTHGELDMSGMTIMLQDAGPRLGRDSCKEKSESGGNKHYYSAVVDRIVIVLCDKRWTRTRPKKRGC